MGAVGGADANGSRKSPRLAVRVSSVCPLQQRPKTLQRRPANIRLNFDSVNLFHPDPIHLSANADPEVLAEWICTQAFGTVRLPDLPSDRYPKVKNRSTSRGTDLTRNNTLRGGVSSG